MSFNEYIDDLAKRGVIDGNITERLFGLHRAEIENPCKAIRDAVDPILSKMWADRDGVVNRFADDIDDAIDAASKK